MIDRRLQVFNAVAELKSFTRAGQRLHMTQPAVTFQIRQLEEHFNTRLFDREHNRIELTEAGRQLRGYARRILALYSEMDGSLRELTDDMAGTLMLGASMTIAEYDLPRLLVRFKRRFPEVSVKLLVSNTDGIVQMVVENRIDLGLVEGPVHNRSLAVRRYDVDRLVAALPPGHALADEPRIPFETLRGVPLILREEGSGTREVFLDHARKAGFALEDFDVAMELGSPEAIKGAVEGRSRHHRHLRRDPAQGCRAGHPAGGGSRSADRASVLVRAPEAEVSSARGRGATALRHPRRHGLTPARPVRHRPAPIPRPATGGCSRSGDSRRALPPECPSVRERRTPETAPHPRPCAGG